MLGMDGWTVKSFSQKYIGFVLSSLHTHAVQAFFIFNEHGEI